ncbi:MAG: ABC transporter ATP-binding protein [Opitutaceae bacterium]|nr:ABC transporter ATP-binding protein [Opitutaceae bacterium]
MAAWLNARIPVILGDLASSMENAGTATTSWGIREATGGLLVLGGCFLLRELANVARRVTVHRVATTAERDIMTAVVGHLLRLDLAEFSAQRLGSIQGRVKRSVDGFVRLLRLGFMDFLPSFLTAGFAVWVAFSRNREIGILIASAVPVLLGIVWWQASSQRGIRVTLLRTKEQMEGTFVEQVAGLEYIRCADTQDEEEGRIAREADALRAQEMRHHTAMAGFDFLKTMAESTYFVAVAALSTWLAAHGRLPIGEIITQVMLFNSVLGPVREVHRVIDEASEASIAVDDLRELLAKPLDRSFMVAPPSIGSSPVGPMAIDARNLKLGYAGNCAVRFAVDGVDIHIPAGQIVGIAGLAGCGKSTFLKSLLRLVHPADGDVWLAGRPIASFSRRELRENIAVVGQTPFLFSGTLRENLCYGLGPVDETRLAAAVRAVGLEVDLREMPKGLNHPVHERGANLSGGQRQRIALARMLLEPRPILIVDEGTSALDYQSELTVLTSLAALRGRATILMIAHRLGTLRQADRILVFERGRIIEDGAFEELRARNGRFAALLLAAASSPKAA